MIVKANPLHPDTQKAGATAEGPIQAAIVQAERKAQAAYERAVAELKRTGKISAELTGISLEDEGIAGEKIDAELELTIDLEPGARPFEVTSSQPPVIAAGTTGMTWVVTIPANTYREPSGPDTREHFRAAEARLYFGALARPTVSKRDDRPRFSVALTPTLRDVHRHASRQRDAPSESPYHRRLEPRRSRKSLIFNPLHQLYTHRYPAGTIATRPPSNPSGEARGEFRSPQCFAFTSGISRARRRSLLASYWC